MLKKLGKSITIANAIAFTVVILVGGVSIYLTKDILHNAYRVEGLSKDIITINGIHSDSYRLIVSIHHFLIHHDDHHSEEAIELIDRIKLKIDSYRDEELNELVNGDNRELELIDIILDDIKGLKGVEVLMEGFDRTGTFDRDELLGLETFAYELEDTVKQINKIHMVKIQLLIDESMKNMWMILFIYLVFITIGGLAIFAAHRMLLKKVVTPIKSLAAATIDFADGKLDKRVSTDSQNEIGQLYQSFNRMAEKIQQNDEVLRKFNEKLEQKVEERTLELQEANEQLRKTQNALIRTEKIAAVGQIAAGVTHEIKNPLNSLSINTQMLIRELAEKFGTDSSAHESASLIKSEVNRINNILEEFVKFAKFPEPQLVENDLNHIAEDVADLMTESAKGAGITLEVSLDDSIPMLSCDERQMREVLINLTQNAVRAMKDGGSIHISTSLDKENVIVRVTDTGEGIPDRNLGKIFTPFFSTREGGLGLGLPIVQRIIESHGAKIACESKIGEGTVFEIVFPGEKA